MTYLFLQNTLQVQIRINQIDNAGLSHRHISPKHNTDGNKAEKGSKSQSEKQKYSHTSSKPWFSNTASDVTIYPHQEGIDKKDQTESEDEEIWEDEDMSDIDNEDD